MFIGVSFIQKFGYCYWPWSKLTNNVNIFGNFELQFC